MVVEQFPDFLQWLTGGDSLTSSAIFTFFLIAVGAGLTGAFFGYLFAAFRHGPFEAFYVVANVIFGSVPDFIRTSPRRISAMAYLAVKEALRRRIVLATFVIFAIALLFGGWFMNSDSENPERVYVGFVTWGTQLLVLMMGLLISAFSLPDDIKNKTIYTVVTKPVRATEIILGRIIGFMALGTLLLFSMGFISLLFVWRGLAHDHVVDADSQVVASFDDVDLTTGLSVEGRRVSDGTVKTAETNRVNGHRHQLEVVREYRRADAPQPSDMGNVIKVEERDGEKIYYRVIARPERGHSHRVELDGEDDEAEINLGSSQGYFRSRVPIYARQLTFFDREGKLKPGGTSIGDEWTYRGYIDGGTSLSKAVYEYQNFSPARFDNPDLIELELTLGVFRTYMGSIERRIRAQVVLESVANSPDAEDAENYVKFQSEPFEFETQEFKVQTLGIARKLVGRKLTKDGDLIPGQDGIVVDLFDDLAPNGKLRLIVRCIDRAQYIGVSRGDIYFRASDKAYWINFFRGYVGIWLQMLIVISLAVALSTFLSAPVTMLGTFIAIIVGFFGEFIRDLTSLERDGGGPIESFIRLITQRNMQTPLPQGLATTVMEETDKVLIQMLNSIAYIMPNFGRFDFSRFLTYGYWIDNDRMFVATMLALSFCFGISVFGYFCLKTREIAG